MSAVVRVAIEWRGGFLARDRAIRVQKGAPSRRHALGSREERHTLPDGVELEVISHIPENSGDKEKPPLVFLHGTAHGAWCYREHFLPYFAERGFPSYALSFRGQGGSDGRDLKFSGTLESHAEDVMHFTKTLKTPPIIIGHSFGGLFVQYMSLNGKREHFQAFAALCSVPPSGNRQMIQRFMKRDFALALKISWVLLRRVFTREVDAARFLFFSEDFSDEDVQRCQEEWSKSGTVTIIDTGKLEESLPLPSPIASDKPAFVLGAANDKLVDEIGVQETADWYGVKPIIIPNMAHDVMLDARWEKAASALSEWLETVLD